MSAKRFAPKLKLKTGDKVKVIAGAHKGEEGEIRQVFPTDNRAVVTGVNFVKRHVKGTQDNPGGINEFEAPLHISNLKLVDPKTGVTTRVGRKNVDGKIVRYSKKSGEIIK